MATLEEILINANVGGSYLFISLASGAISNLLQKPVILNSIIVNSASMPFTIYDNASGASGTIIVSQDAAAAPYTLMVGARIINGMTMQAPGIATSKITLVTTPV